MQPVINKLVLQTPREHIILRVQEPRCEWKERVISMQMSHVSLLQVILSDITRECEAMHGKCCVPAAHDSNYQKILSGVSRTMLMITACMSQL